MTTTGPGRRPPGAPPRTAAEPPGTRGARPAGGEAGPVVEDRWLGPLESGAAVRPGPTRRARVREVSATGVRDRRDDLATEEPLEIRLSAGGHTRTLAITMRTPGADFELAAGFLSGEGIAGPDEIASIAYCTDEDLPPEARYNTVTVRLHGDTLPDSPALHRHFVTSSACGVCGTASLDALRTRRTTLGRVAPPALPPVPAEVLYTLPDRLRAAQGVFGKTGGLHAAGLFTADGSLLAVREDVGRHNAVDKLVGWALLSGRLPLAANLLLVSGRTSYEIMQKALAAGIPMVCGVSAPSSLAVDLAREFGLTLVGFLRGERFNIYATPDRVIT
ncbi:sulfurtransferase FdhD [Sphaerisporangium melleum]|uniref:Sulfur carrier protein FdhD n=1 Tax=Sphaerisporangium melleum TaxID=321316 RepID=A0A917VDH4_9ACTN|nr:formate dehydrogenase accessory sulfurtransferase FdhD [Sphaerisporangium melleum]GGK65663.1 sulfurtransferase FdhD [Sphaerisporangium melleum]GII69932.1 sulfurtransferase FdhD [Sphaerisporangium melleum]